MTAPNLRALLLKASATVPHAPGAIDVHLSYVPYMSRADREHAAACYAAVIGSRMLPADIGERRNARRRIEERNDMRGAG